MFPDPHLEKPCCYKQITKIYVWGFRKSESLTWIPCLHQKCFVQYFVVSSIQMPCGTILGLSMWLVLMPQLESLLPTLENISPSSTDSLIRYSFEIMHKIEILISWWFISSNSRHLFIIDNWYSSAHSLYSGYCGSIQQPHPSRTGGLHCRICGPGHWIVDGL